MAPTRVGTESTLFSSAALTSYSLAHTVPAGTNCLAIYIGACLQGSMFNISQVTWNGQALDALVQPVGFSFAAGAAGVWLGMLLNPGIGTHTVQVTLDVAPDSLAMHAVNIAGVNTMAPVADTLSEGTFFVTTSTFGNVITSDAPVLIFGGIAMTRPPGAASFSPAAGVSELADGTASGRASSRHFAGVRREGAAGSYHFGATCTQAGIGACAAVALRGI